MITMTQEYRLIQTIEHFIGMDRSYLLGHLSIPNFHFEDKVLTHSELGQVVFHSFLGNKTEFKYEGEDFEAFLAALHHSFASLRRIGDCLWLPNRINAMKDELIQNIKEAKRRFILIDVKAPYVFGDFRALETRADVCVTLPQWMEAKPSSRPIIVFKPDTMYIRSISADVFYQINNFHKFDVLSTGKQPRVIDAYDLERDITSYLIAWEKENG